MEPTVVQLVHIDETGDSYYRMRWPGRHLAQQAPQWRVISLDARAAERFEWGRQADLLVVYQSHDVDLLPVLQDRRRRGLKTLVEYNDNFYSPASASPIFDQWSSPLLWQTYELFLREADGVLVTGPGLQQLLRDKTDRPIFVLENHLPDRPPDFDQLWSPVRDEIRLGWAGSLSHMADLLAAVPVFRRLLDRWPSLRLHLMGNQSIPSLLGLPSNRVRFTPWGTMDDYFRFWREVHVGVALMLDTPCNRCRSDIKAVEMAGSGVLPVLPRLLPYQTFLDATPAPSYGTLAELAEVLDSLFRSPETVERLARRCWDYVRTQRVGPDRTERLRVFSQFLPDRPSDYRWPVPVGYHELTGTPRPQLARTVTLSRAERLVAEGRLDAARELLEQSLRQNPLDADVALAHVRVLRKTGDARFGQLVETYARRFPLDLRFRLVAVTAQAEPQRRVEQWQRVADALRRQSRLYRRFFQKDVARLFARDTARGLPLLEVGRELVRLLPESAELRLAVAELCRLAGRWDEAAGHFRWLARARDACLANHEFFAKTPRSYVAVWDEALNGPEPAESGSQ